MTGREAPPPPQTAAEVLDRTRALFGLADHELILALVPAIRDRASDFGTEDHYRRAEVMAALAAAGAQVAQAMLAAEDEQLAEELDRHLGPYPTPLGRPPALPNATDGYLDRLEAWRDDIADAARVATGAGTPETTAAAAAEVRRLVDVRPRREEHGG